MDRFGITVRIVCSLERAKEKGPSGFTRPIECIFVRLNKPGD